jgi:hypothetical protein
MPRKRPERNTYKLPKGEAIRRELVKVFREQRRAIIAAVKGQKGFKADRDEGFGIGGGVVPAIDWDALILGPLKMAERFVPLLSTIWDAAGMSLLARVGEDPERWDVEDPNLQRQISEAALAFCEETNATTTQQLDEALAATRRELAIAGPVEDLTKRINAIFDGAETWRARRIATSEAARAYHAAELESAIESEVVAGFEWLLSGDACPLCLTVARRCPRVPLGQKFAVVGDHPVYAEIRFPPLHPQCQCSVKEILLPEYGGPRDVQWGQTLTQPQPEEQDINAFETYEPPGPGEAR